MLVRYTSYQGHINSRAHFSQFHICVVDQSDESLAKWLWQAELEPYQRDSSECCVPSEQPLRMEMQKYGRTTILVFVAILEIDIWDVS
jgi:hypothetical protein